MPSSYVSLTPEVFLKTSLPILRSAAGLSVVVQHRRFRAMFGVTPLVCSIVWDLIGDRLPKRSSPQHLLWALMFLKVYASEHVNHVMSGADEKTFRKWAWSFIKLIADLKVIRWCDRFEGQNDGPSKVSVDGSDFKIYEPTPFSGKWYSHKFNGPGLRYEVGLCIATGHIVWVHGPFPCGSFPDLSIFRLGMKKMLQDGETVIADGGYQDERCKQSACNSDIVSAMASVIRARHETVNRRMKQFFVLGHMFRHMLPLHSACFHAVATLTQLLITNGEPLFSVDINE